MCSVLRLFKISSFKLAVALWWMEMAWLTHHPTTRTIPPNRMAALYTGSQLFKALRLLRTHKSIPHLPDPLFKLTKFNIFHIYLNRGASANSLSSARSIFNLFIHVLGGTSWIFNPVSSLWRYSQLLRPKIFLNMIALNAYSMSMVVYSHSRYRHFI